MGEMQGREGEIERRTNFSKSVCEREKRFDKSDREREGEGLIKVCV